MSRAVDGGGLRRSRRRRVLIGLALVAAIAVVVYLNLRRQRQAETFATVATERAALVDRLAETGAIELVRTVEVKSTIAGEVRELLVEAGERVEAEQLLAVIEPDPNQSLQLYQKRSAVQRSELNLADVEREFERQRTLFERRMVSAQEFEAAETRLTQARNDLRLARLELAILETKANLAAQGQGAAGSLDAVRVLAPIGGIVIQRGVEIGEVVASGLNSYTGGTLLFVIGDPSRMIVRGDIAEVDIADLAPGQDVEIVVDAYPDTTYRGRVRWIAPVAERKQGSPIVTFDTEIEVLDRDPRLRQGMSCDIDIIFARRDSALCLPATAVLEIPPEDGEDSGRGKTRYVAYRVIPDSSGTDAAAGGAADHGAVGGAVEGQQHTAADAVPGDAAAAMAAPDTAEPGGTDAVAPAVAADQAAPDGVASAGMAESAGPGAGGPPDTLDRGAVDTAALPDTASRAVADSAAVDSADSGAAAEAPAPPSFALDRFAEVDLTVGLETSTRIEILAGLQDGDRVAADPQTIRQRREEAAAARKEQKGSR